MHGWVNKIAMQMFDMPIMCPIGLKGPVDVLVNNETCFCLYNARGSSCAMHILMF